MEAERLKRLAEKFADELKTSESLQGHAFEHQRRSRRAQDFLTIQRIPSLTEGELRELFFDSDAFSFWKNKEWEFNNRLQNVGLEGLRRALSELIARAEKGLSPEDLKYVWAMRGLGTLLATEMLAYVFPDRYWTYAASLTLPAFQILGDDVKASMPSGQKSNAYLYLALEPRMAQVRQALNEAGIDRVDNLLVDIFLFWIKETNQPKETKSQRFWKISPGEQGRAWGEFRNRNVIAIGWPESGDLQQADVAGREQLQARLEQTDLGAGQSAAHAAKQLWMLYGEMQPGDFVCAYGKGQILGWGEIVGSYMHQADDFSYPHRRPMRWISTEAISADGLSAGMLKKIQQNQTIIELSANEFEQIQKADGASNVWLFQANPKYFDLVASLELKKENDEDRWSVTSYRNEMKPGDEVVFWLSGKESGIYAIGELIGYPYKQEPDHPGESSYAISERPYMKSEWRVDYRYTHILTEPILREDLKEHPVLGSLGVLKFANATNFRVTPEEWTAIQALLEKPGVSEWDRGSEQSAREVIEALLPDADVRRTCLSLLADYIVEAHRQGQATWGVTLFNNRNGFRLNVGRMQAWVLEYSQIRMVLDAESLDEQAMAELKQHCRLLENEYLIVPDTLDVVVAAQELAAILSIAQESYSPLVARAAKTARRTPWFGSHSPGVVAYIRRFLGREIPDPVYGEDSLKKEPKQVIADSIKPVDARYALAHSLAASGLHFTTWQIAAFYTALQAKHFVILSGISGTGKTKLAQNFAALLPQPSGDGSKAQDESITITVQPYMLRHNRLIIPKQATRLFDPPLPGQSAEVVLSFDGQGQSCRLVHAAYTNKDYLSLLLRGSARQWFSSRFSEGDTLILEPQLDQEQTLTGFRLLMAVERKNNKNESASGQNWLFVPVRTDWRDSKSLIGYYNPLTAAYEWTPFLRFLLRAAQSYRNNDRLAWFVILDEMNLAHVEYYFADLLSVLESGRDGKGWTREALRFGYADEAEGDLPPRELKLPPNLYFVGTVNVDETTHAFSPKVLDRAFTFELTEADFTDYPPALDVEHRELADNERLSLLKAFTLDGDFSIITKQRILDYVSKHTEVRERLQSLNNLLRRFTLHFGYRVFDEIVYFLDASERNGMFVGEKGSDPAFDAAVLMKVLPKFHGSRGKLEAPLQAILAWAVNPDAPAEETIVDALKQVESGNDVGEALSQINYMYPATAERVQRMLRALYTDGFAAFG